MATPSEDQLDLPLPIYRGRISQDWSSHETRVKAWLRVKGIPLHASESVDVLVLSLEPESTPALSLSRAGADLKTFEAATTYLRANFDSLSRRKFAQDSARNALDSRFFQMRGRRTEQVKDLISDLENLFERAGVVDDEDKRGCFVRTFIDHSKAIKAFSKCSTYTEVITEALRFESLTIAREFEERRTAFSRPRTQGTSSPLKPQGGGTSTRPTSPSPIRPFELPSSLSPSRLTSGGAGPSSSPPSTIDEATEELQDPKHQDRPDAPTPGGRYFVEPNEGSQRQYDSVASRLSFRSGLPGFGESSGRGEWRSRSIDFGNRRGRLGDELGGTDDGDELERAASTPPYVHAALHSDDEDDDEEEGGGENEFVPAPPRSASVPLGETDQRRTPRKLVKRNSGRSGGGAAGGEGSILSASTSTVTGRMKPKEVLKNWFSRGSSTKQEKPGEVDELGGRPAKVRGGGIA